VGVVRLLRLTSGPGAGQTFEVDRELVLGRERVDVLLDDPEISRRHAIIRPVERGVSVEDLGSTNGTYVNGKRITEATVLADRGTIRLGATHIDVEVHVPTQATDPAQTPPAQEPAPAPQPDRPPARGTVRRLT
jgi:pSer/pThr/pTyr-binding forkhead associated (FHA) protein